MGSTPTLANIFSETVTLMFSQDFISAVFLHDQVFYLNMAIIFALITHCINNDVILYFPFKLTLYMFTQDFPFYSTLANRDIEGNCPQHAIVG